MWITPDQPSCSIIKPCPASRTINRMIAIFRHAVQQDTCAPGSKLLYGRITCSRAIPPGRDLTADFRKYALAPEATRFRRLKLPSRHAKNITTTRSTDTEFIQDEGSVRTSENIVCNEHVQLQVDGKSSVPKHPGRRQGGPPKPRPDHLGTLEKSHLRGWGGPRTMFDTGSIPTSTTSRCCSVLGTDG